MMLNCADDAPACGRIEARARQIGPHAHAFVVKIMESKLKPELGLPSCYGVLRLAKEYGEERLESACCHALGLGTETLRGLDSILRTGSDRMPSELQDSGAPIIHGNIRGAEYYK